METSTATQTSPTTMIVVPPKLRPHCKELGIDPSPCLPRRMLRFDENRTWISLASPRDYLRKYAAFQEGKYEPPVFADELPTYNLDWQRRRELFFKRRGRLDRLKVLKSVRHWPYIFGIPTRAPFIHCPEHRHTENFDNHKLPIFKALAIPELARSILDYCAESFISVSELGLTCWTAFEAIAANIEHWNLTDRDFLGKNNSAPLGQGGPVSDIFMVSQVRPVMDRKADRSRRNTSSFSAEFRGLTDLFHALKNSALTITNLQLHRVPFLSVEATRCIATSLQNLRNLGLYQCPLLHFAVTGKLLDIVEKCEDSSGFIHLDFFPAFHQGPNTAERQGSFGATWADPGINTTAAIFKLVLYEYYPKARKLGLDLFDDGCAFRLWLEKCPLPDWSIVQANEAVKTYESDRETRTLDHWMTDLEDKAFERFTDELAAAMFADSAEPGVVPGHVLFRLLGARRGRAVIGGDHYRRYGWWRETSNRCTYCGPEAPVLLPFFPYCNYSVCYGCRLSIALEAEDDHMKQWQARAAEKWLGTEQGRLTLAEALAKPSWWEGAHCAERADYVYKFDKENKHEAGCRDIPWRLGYTSLDYRYRRHREPHGGIDRRRGERQYLPAGRENWEVSIDLTTPALFFAPVFENETMRAQVVRAIKEQPETAECAGEQLCTRIFNILAHQFKLKLSEMTAEEHRDKVERQCYMDVKDLVFRHSTWETLPCSPNRPAPNWDEMRNRVLEGR